MARVAFLLSIQSASGVLAKVQGASMRANLLKLFAFLRVHHHR